MSQKIPKFQRAVIIDEFKGKPYVKEIPVPEPKHGEVLIRVECCSLNPADNSFLKGQYSSKRKPPTTIGLEGSGVVVKNGGGWLGCHVSFLSKDSVMGTWCEYTIADANFLIYQPLHRDFILTGSSTTNPVTVTIMAEITEQEQHKAVITTASASAVGKMIYRYFTNKGIDVINVVRRQDQIEIMKKQEGVKWIVCTEDKNWQQQLKEIVEKLKPTCLWDVVAGELMGQILKIMPPSSVCYCYGQLSLKNCQVDAAELIFKKKQIKGFWTTDQIKKRNLYWRVTNAWNIKNSIETTLKTQIVKEFSLENVNEAVEHYKKHMSEGKCFMRPHLSEKQIAENNAKRMIEQSKL